MNYLYIRAWGRALGSMGYYVQGEIAKAQAANAPERAVYFSPGQQRWITIDECVPETQAAIFRIAAEIKEAS